MKKLLTVVSTVALFTNMAIAPAFANSLERQIELETEYQMVLPEGEMMSDAELAEVEGELVWKPILLGAGVGAIQGVGVKTYHCYTIPGARCGWRQYAGAAAGGAVMGAIYPGVKAYGAVNSAKYAARTWFLRR